MKGKREWKVFGRMGGKPDFIPADLGTENEIDGSIKGLVKELKEYWLVNSKK